MFHSDSFLQSAALMTTKNCPLYLYVPKTTETLQENFSSATQLVLSRYLCARYIKVAKYSRQVEAARVGI
jgi:hypothetical protein